MGKEKGYKISRLGVIQLDTECVKETKDTTYESEKGQPSKPLSDVARNMIIFTIIFSLMICASIVAMNIYHRKKRQNVGHLEQGDEESLASGV